AEQSLVRRLLTRLGVQQVELALMANECLPRLLHAGSQGDGRSWCDSKAQVVGLLDRRCEISEKSLWRWLELNDNLGSCQGKTFTSAEVPGHSGPAPRIDQQSECAECIHAGCPCDAGQLTVTAELAKDQVARIERAHGP